MSNPYNLPTLKAVAWWRPAHAHVWFQRRDACPMLCLGSWRFARTPARVYAMGGGENAVVLPSADVRGFGRVLQQRGFQVFVRDGALYAFRGLGGKLGPIGVHAAMLAIMGGARFERLPSCVAPPTWGVAQPGGWTLQSLLQDKAAGTKFWIVLGVPQERNARRCGGISGSVEIREQRPSISLLHWEGRSSKRHRK